MPKNMYIFLFTLFIGLKSSLMGSCVSEIQKNTELTAYRTASEMRKIFFDRFIERTSSCKDTSRMHDAVLENNSTLVSHLLEQGFDSHSRDKYGFTPLYCAFYLGEVEIARLLFTAGEHLEVPNNAPSGIFEVPPLLITTLYDDPDLTKLLFEYEGTNELRNSTIFLGVLTSLIGRNGYKTLPLILEAGKNLGELLSVKPQAFTDAISIARSLPLRLDLLLPPLLKAGMKIDQRVSSNGTLLHLIACEEGIYGTANIQALLRAGASLHARSTIGETPLLAAAKCGSLDSVRTLLKAGANINDEDDFGRNALKEILYRKSAPVDTALTHRISRPHAYENDLRDSLERMPLFLSAIWKVNSQYSEVIQLLVEAGISYTKRDALGRKPIPSPLWKIELEKVLALIAAKLKVEDLSTSQCTQEIKKLRHCYQREEFPSKVRPIHYFVCQNTCSALCASQVKNLSICLVNNHPLVENEQILLFLSPLFIVSTAVTIFSSELNRGLSCGKSLIYTSCKVLVFIPFVVIGLAMLITHFDAENYRPVRI